MKPLNQREDGCLICGNPYVEEHHIFFGNPNRKHSEEYNCKCYLCHAHHNEPKTGAHFNRDFDLNLKQECQKRFEEEYGHDKFIAVFGRNWL